MEPEGSLLWSEVHAYPDQSNPTPPSYFLRMRVNTVSSSAPRFSNWSFALTFSH